MSTERALFVNAMLDTEEKLRICKEIISELVEENKKLRDKCTLREKIIIQLYNEALDTL